MSVDMEQAEPYGDAVQQFDQEGYNLDLDAGVEANDIDFQLETFDAEVQYQISATEPDNGLPTQADDIEIGYDEETVVVDDHHDNHDEQTETGRHQAASANVKVDYVDEIGYDDEEDGEEDGGDAAAGPAPEPDSSAPQAVSGESKFDGQPQESDHEDTAQDQTYGDASLHNEHADQEHRATAAGSQSSASSVNDSDLAIHELDHSVSHNTELEQIDEASGDISELPYVEVHYKETRYSLFGTPDDDPDSFFLSEVKHLDIPLYEFLIAIRHVVEDEISPHDELSIRIPSLSFEFGERSRESFLRAHNFREIHDCWARLFFDGAEESSYLVLHLVVCQDPEHRLAELLAQSEQPHTSALLEGPGEYPEDQKDISFNDAGKDGDATEHDTDANTGYFEDHFEDESDTVAKADFRQSVVEGQEFDPQEGHDEENDGIEAVTDEQHTHPTNGNGFEMAGDEIYFEEHEMADGDVGDVGDVGDGEDAEYDGQEPLEVGDNVPIEVGDDYEDGDILADVEVTETGETEVSVVGAAVEMTSEYYGNSPFSSQPTITPDNYSSPGKSVWDPIDYSDDEEEEQLLSPTCASTSHHELVSSDRASSTSGAGARHSIYSPIEYSDEECDTSTRTSGLKRKLGSNIFSGTRPFKKAKIDAQVGEESSFTPDSSAESNLERVCCSQTPRRMTGFTCDEPSFSTPALSFGSPSSPRTTRHSSPVQVTDDSHSSIVAARDTSGELSPVLGTGFVMLTPDNLAMCGDAALARFHDFDLDLNACWNPTDIFTQDEELNIDIAENPSLAPHEPPAGQDSHDEAEGQNGCYDDHSAAPTEQQESTHTSATSTVDGDEIDYEDNTVEDESLVLNPDNDEQLDMTNEEEDEIDWRNDEDEEEAAILPTAESPSSVSVKRSRTDDDDHSDDEADHKRRRT